MTDTPTAENPGKKSAKHPAGTDPTDYRIEHDSMGEVRVPRDALCRAQTQRAVENFPISGVPIERALIGALASVKGAAAAVNGELGVLDADVAQAIHDAAAEVARGDSRRALPDRRVPDRLAGRRAT